MLLPKRVSTVAFAVVLAASFGLTACSGGQESQASQENQEQATENSQEEAASTDVEPTYTEYGTSSSSSKSVLLTNDTGKDIANIAIKDSTAESYGDGVIAGSAVWDAGSQIKLNYAGGAGSYNLLLTVGEESFEMHNVDLSKFSEALVELNSDNVPYLSYEENGKTVTTLDAELAARQAEADAAAALAAEAQAQKEAEEQAQAEAAAAAEAEAAAQAATVYEPAYTYTEPSYQDQSYAQTYDYSYTYDTGSGSSSGYTYDYGSNDTGSSYSGGSDTSSSGSGSSDVSQSGDSCVEGGVVLR